MRLAFVFANTIIKRWSRVKNHENHAQFTRPPPLHVVVAAEAYRRACTDFVPTASHESITAKMKQVAENLKTCETALAEYIGGDAAHNIVGQVFLQKVGSNQQGQIGVIQTALVLILCIRGDIPRERD
jgi:hypothetical protein